MTPFLSFGSVLRVALLTATAALPLRAAVAPEAGAVHPLAVGDRVPSATVRDAQGNVLDLATLVRAQPTVLIVYRGGWCPFCNRHLGELAELEPQLAELGYRVVAISPESAETLAAQAAKDAPPPHRLVLSDRAMVAAEALGLAYQVPENTVQRYRQAGIDLAPLAGHDGAYWLPVPAAFVFDRDGVIRFAFAQPDYRVRIDGETLLAAARAAATAVPKP